MSAMTASKTVYIPSMGSLKVSLNQPEELEHRHIEVMLISVRIFRQESLVERILMKRFSQVGRYVDIFRSPGYIL